MWYYTVTGRWTILEPIPTLSNVNTKAANGFSGRERFCLPVLEGDRTPPCPWLHLLLGREAKLRLVCLEWGSININFYNILSLHPLPECSAASSASKIVASTESQAGVREELCSECCDWWIPKSPLNDAGLKALTYVCVWLPLPVRSAARLKSGTLQCSRVSRECGWHRDLL